MTTPRVSNYNRERRSQEPLFLKTKLTLIPLDTLHVQIVGKTLVEELRNLRLEVPPLPTELGVGHVAPPHFREKERHSIKNDKWASCPMLNPTDWQHQTKEDSEATGRTQWKRLA